MPKQQTKPIQVRLASGRQFEVKRSGQLKESKYPVPRTRVPLQLVRTRPRKRNAAVGLAVRSRNPAVRSSILSKPHTRVSGHEFLSSVTGATTQTTGTSLYTVLLSPSNLGVGRLAAFSRLYEKFRFRKFIVTYIPIAAATVAGQVMGYFDTDPAETVYSATPLAAFQRGVAHFGAQSTNVWERKSFSLQDDDPTRLLFCNETEAGSERLAKQARFTLLSSSAQSATALGNLFVEYEVDFYGPQIDASPIAGSAILVTSGAGQSDEAPLGTVPIISPASNIASATVTSDSITVPAGHYIAYAWLNGTGVTQVAFDFPAGPTLYASNVNNFSVDAKNGCAFMRIGSTAPITAQLLTTATTHVACAYYILTVPSGMAAVPPLTLSARLSQLEAVSHKDDAQERKTIVSKVVPTPRVSRAADSDGEMITTQFDPEYTLVRKK